MRFIIFSTLSALHWLIVCWLGWTWILGAEVDDYKMIIMAFIAGAYSQLTAGMMRWYDYRANKKETDHG